MPDKRRVLGPTILIYAVLLLLSHAVRWAADTRQPEITPGIRIVDLGHVQLALEDIAGPDSPERHPVLLIHGSPGKGADFRRMAAAMKGSRRLLIPDLPGFGSSTRKTASRCARSYSEASIPAPASDKANNPGLSASRWWVRSCAKVRTASKPMIVTSA